jgi:undecaprenyl-diphosphatase
LRPLHDFRLPGDEVLYHALNDLDWPWLVELSRLLSNRGLEIALVVLLLAHVLYHHRSRALATVLLTVGAIIVSDRLGAAVFKPAFARQRPCYALGPGEFHRREQVAHSGSMPSLHASNAFAAALPLSLGAPELAPVVYGVATLIALSRVQLGVHWPSDILAGAVIGTLIAAGLVALCRLVFGRWHRKRSGDP